MKIKNLYVGTILVISNNEYNFIFDVENYECRKQAGSIFYKSSIKKGIVKNILDNREYIIGFPTYNPEVGDEFVVCLDTQPITEILCENSYNKKNISKRKILDFVTKDENKYKKILGGSYEEVIRI